MIEFSRSELVLILSALAQVGFTDLDLKLWVFLETAEQEKAFVLMGKQELERVKAAEYPSKVGT